MSEGESLSPMATTCPCISQSNEGVVRCERETGHEGLHAWHDPVHPGHSKLWGGYVTDIQGDTRYRYESSRRTAARMGVAVDGQGNARYLPMAGTNDIPGSDLNG